MIEGRLFLVLLGLSGLTVGHLAFEAGVRDYAGLRMLPTLEKLFAKLALGFCLTTWLGVVLAEAGRFGPVALLASIAAAAVALLLLLWRRERPIGSRLTFDLDDSLAVVVLLVGIGSYLYFPTVDNYFVARDPGVYRLTGVRLAREGGLAFRDPVVDAMGPEERFHFFPPYHRPADFDSTRYMGFYLEDREEARVVPQAMPGFPVWVAVGYLADGLDGAAAASAWLAVLGAIALYYLGRRLAGRLAGTLAALLLAGNFVQTWFARNGAAETAAQALLLIGCYGLLLQRRHRDPFAGGLAALGLGLVALIKAELVLVFGAVAVLFLADLARDRMAATDRAGMWLPLGLLGFHTLLHYRLWTWPYIADLLRVVGLSPSAAAAVMAGGTLGLVAAAAIARRWPEELHARAAAFLRGEGTGGRACRWILSVAVLLLAAYGYWIRPGFSGGWDHLNVVELAWAISAAGLGAAVLGAVASLHDRSAGRGFGAVVGILLALSAWVLFDRDIVPRLFWAYRRYVPVLLPTSFLMVGYLAGLLWERGPGWLVDRVAPGDPDGSVAAEDRRERWQFRLRLAAAGIVVLMALPVSVRQLDLHRRYGGHREMAGSDRFLRELDEVLEPDSLVVFEPRTKAGGLTRFEAATAFLLDRRVVRLPDPEVDPAFLLRLVRRHAEEGRAAYLLTTGYPEYFPFPRAQYLETLEFRTEILEEPKDRLPSSVVRLVFRPDLYRLVPEERNDLPEPGVLDVGERSPVYLGLSDWHGWHGADREEGGGWTRWTDGRARAWLPGLGLFDGPLRIRLLSDAPPPARPQWVTATLDGTPMESFVPGPGWAVYEFELPEGWRPRPGAVPELELRSSTWTPAEHGPTDDRRDLGVKVDWIAWGDGEAETRP